MKCIGVLFCMAPLTASAIDVHQIMVVCTPPPSITVTAVAGEERYSSTYKLFGSIWEEIDTESPYDPLPEYLRVSNTDLHTSFKKECPSSVLKKAKTR